MAFREGLELALHRADLPILIEMDSVKAVNMLNASTRGRSRNRVLAEEIKRMKDGETREISITAISHSQNKASHALAATVGVPPPLRARRLLQYAWLGLSMRDIVNLVLTDLPP